MPHLKDSVFDGSKKRKEPDNAVFTGNRNYGWKQSELPLTRCHHDKIAAKEYRPTASGMYAKLTTANITHINKLGRANSNQDFAKYPIVIRNQFYERKFFHGTPALLVDSKIENYVRTKNKAVNAGRRVGHNSIVNVNTVDQRRYDESSWRSCRV